MSSCVPWPSILQQAERRRITGLWYDVEDGHLHLELDDGSVLLVAASWEGGCHVVVDPGVPATRKGRPTKEPPLCYGQAHAIRGKPWVVARLARRPGLSSPGRPDTGS